MWRFNERVTITMSRAEAHAVEEALRHAAKEVFEDESRERRLLRSVVDRMKQQIETKDVK